MLLTFVVAEDRTNARGQTFWQEIKPRAHRLLILGRPASNPDVPDSLDIPSLATLEAHANRKVSDWPLVDLRTSISWSPHVPQPGEVVTFSFQVENTGRRDAERAEVNILVGVPQGNQELKEIRRQWFPRIPAGQAVSLDISNTLPIANALASINVRAFQDIYPVREVNVGNNGTVIEVGRGLFDDSVRIPASWPPPDQLNFSPPSSP